MTKSEYMNALQNKLECFNRELQQEIVEDYEQHFAEGIAAGKTEEEIVAELGSIEDMIQELPEEDIRHDDQPLEKGSLDNTYTGEYKAVVIDGGIANVSLRPSDDGQIHLSYRNDGNELVQQEYRFYQYEEEGVFYAGVKQDRNASEKEAKRAVKIMLFGKTLDLGSFDLERTFQNIWKGGDSNVRLDVRIPMGMPAVTVKTVSGNLSVQDVTPQQLDLCSTSGDVEIRHVTVDSLRLNTTSGDVTARQTYASDADVHTASGDVELDDTEVAVLHFEGASGDISGKRVRGTEATIGTGSGDIELDGCFERYSVRTGSGDVDVRAETGARNIRITTGSGDVELDVTAVPDTEVTVGTGSGQAVIYSAGNVRQQVTRGTCTVGSGDCKVHVNTGSGDAKVRRH